MGNALHMASMYGHLEVAKLLLQKNYLNLLLAKVQMIFANQKNCDDEDISTKFDMKVSEAKQ